MTALTVLLQRRLDGGRILRQDGGGGEKERRKKTRHQYFCGRTSTEVKERISFLHVPANAVKPIPPIAFLDVRGRGSAARRAYV
jgi:hypothetical protein